MAPLAKPEGATWKACLGVEIDPLTEPSLMHSYAGRIVTAPSPDRPRGAWGRHPMASHWSNPRLQAAATSRSRRQSAMTVSSSRASA